MQRLTILGLILVGLALAGLGAIQWATQDYLTSLLPITSLPFKALWVNLTAVIFLLCGVLLLIRQVVVIAAGAAAALFGLLFIYPHLFRLVASTLDPRIWTVTFETLALCAGTCFIAIHEQRKARPGFGATALFKGLGVGSRFLFAASLLVFGVQHFLYQNFIISLMPAWLPGKVGWAYLVKYGFLLAAISLVLNKAAHWGLLLLGVMYFTWVLILHAPRSLAAMTNPDEWTSLCIALAMAGISFYFAGSLIAKKNDDVLLHRTVAGNDTILNPQ